MIDAWLSRSQNTSVSRVASACRMPTFAAYPELKSRAASVFSQPASSASSSRGKRRGLADEPRGKVAVERIAGQSSGPQPPPPASCVQRQVAVGGKVDAVCGWCSGRDAQQTPWRRRSSSSRDNRSKSGPCIERLPDRAVQHREHGVHLLPGDDACGNEIKDITERTHEKLRVRVLSAQPGKRKAV